MTTKNKPQVGHTLTIDDRDYYVKHVCRGEGHARTIHRQTPGSVYRAVLGQWVVLKAKHPEEVPGQQWA